jgi:hypothetical protein
MKPNGYVYETFGTSKHFPVKLQILFIWAEMFDNALTAKCFIYDVVLSCFFNQIPSTKIKIHPMLSFGFLYYNLSVQLFLMTQQTGR